MQRNLFLTDLMTTGDHRTYDQFLYMSTLPNQKIETCNTFFALHLYELENYHRKFAIIDRKLNSLITGKEYKKELERRIALLHAQGFKFIIATPWESKENIQNGDVYPRTNDLKCDALDWTGGTSWFWSYMYMKHRNNNFRFNHELKTKDFLYLNKFPRNHRKVLYDSLRKDGLLENSIYSFLGLDDPVRIEREYELPWVDPKNYPKYGMDQDLYELPYNDSAISIVSETNDNDFDVFMTEKIWKPIIAQHVFVVHGNYLYLQKLREMGFKTFGNWFNESYDLEGDSQKKIEKIVKLCKDLKQKNHQDLYLQTKSLRKHNYDHFFNAEKLSLEINKTVKLFLEFADRS